MAFDRLVRKSLVVVREAVVMELFVGTNRAWRAANAGGRTKAAKALSATSQPRVNARIVKRVSGRKNELQLFPCDP